MSLNDPDPAAGERRHKEPADAAGRAIPQRRRRGAALETALLDAALAELTTSGYSALTFEAVAARAQTSRAVLYRRWATKPEMVRAALAHARAEDPIDIPDTGTLRGDLIELMRRVSRSRSRLGVMVLTQLSGYFTETGTGPADLRDAFLAAGRANAYDTVFERAIARGEIQRARLTARIAALPMDLLRQEMVMTLKPIPDDTIESIIDEVVLPLLRRGSAPGVAAAAGHETAGDLE